MKLRVRDLAAAAQAQPRSPGGLPLEASVATDSRTLAPGELYVALRGERFDGHAFVGAALARGACGVVVSDASVVPENAPALVVADTLAAYQAFAGCARHALDARVIAVTGSAGKTTTKELLAQLLVAAGFAPVAATPANENNEFGVPKLFLGLDSSVRAVVVEMGARRYGEIAPLTAIARPDVAIVTNIGEAHLEVMGSRERLAETKFEIFGTGAIPVLNVRDAASCERAAGLGREPVWFAASGGEGLGGLKVRSALFVSRTALKFFVAGANVTTYPIRCDLPGDHNLENLAAAFAGAYAAGADLERLAAAVPSLTLPQGRYERMNVGAFDVIYDAYNASMSGTLATLRSFAREVAGRKIAVLSSMAELGPDAPEMHERVGAAAAASKLDALLVGGDYAESLARGARGAGFPAELVINFDDNGRVVDWLRANARAGDLVLLKASRRYKLESVLEGLRSAHA
jgi:UDP-N-acetylmuramoyl-tripeptide--D-alanyl-D-alanine ligase